MKRKIVKVNGGSIKHTGPLNFSETDTIHAEKIIRINFTAHRYNGEIIPFHATFEMIGGEYYYASDHEDNDKCNDILKEMK